MLQDNSPNLTSTVTDALNRVSFNAVYQAHFSDGVSWAVRTPLNRWDATHAHVMRLKWSVHRIKEHWHLNSINGQH